MFKKDFSWIDEYIHWAESNGHPLTMGAFEICKKELEELAEKNRKLTIELSKYKSRKRKTKSGTE